MRAVRPAQFISLVLSSPVVHSVMLKLRLRTFLQARFTPDIHRGAGNFGKIRSVRGQHKIYST